MLGIKANKARCCRGGGRQRIYAGQASEEKGGKVLWMKRRGATRDSSEKEFSQSYTQEVSFKTQEPCKDPIAEGKKRTQTRYVRGCRAGQKKTPTKHGALQRM